MTSPQVPSGLRRGRTPEHERASSLVAFLVARYAEDHFDLDRGAGGPEATERLRAELETRLDVLDLCVGALHDDHGRGGEAVALAVAVLDVLAAPYAGHPEHQATRQAPSTPLR